jgi:uncharacterized protein YkwD
MDSPLRSHSRSCRRRRLLILVLSFTSVALLAPAVSRSDIDLPPIPASITLPPPLGPASQQSVPASPQAAEAAAPTSAKNFSVAATPSLRSAIVTEINRTRRAHGLRPLRVVAGLVRAGTEHARVLATAGLFTHSWSDGKLFPAWIRGFYPSSSYRMWSAGENLLWSASTLTARSAVSQWLASPSHRHILLLPSWREVGIGTVRAVAAPGAYGGQDVDIAAAEFGTRRK